MVAVAALVGVLMGVVIGGLGGGGGVLTVPALVYLLGQSAQDATTSSVIIVGVTALSGVVARLRGGGIDWRAGISFGLAGIPATYLGSYLNHHTRQPVLLLAFAAVTLVAGAAMLLDSRRDRPGRSPAPGAPATDGPALDSRTATGHLVARAAKTVVFGSVVGFLTGFLGVGGGFLVVPALVLALRMPMTLAVGTSLFVITMNSASALITRLGITQLDWAVIAPVTVAAILGSFAGKRIADRLTSGSLTTAFAITLLVVGLAVGTQNLLTL